LVFGVGGGVILLVSPLKIYTIFLKPFFTTPKKYTIFLKSLFIILQKIYKKFLKGYNIYMTLKIGDKVKYKNTYGYIISLPNDNTVCINTFEWNDICVYKDEVTKYDK
jgi:uncharacterized membrane protein YukC